MTTVYVLKSLSSGRLYVGQTNNIARRCAEHNQGQCPATRGRGPYTLIHSENFETRTEAIKRELFLKSGQGRELLGVIKEGVDRAL